MTDLAGKVLAKLQQGKAPGTTPPVSGADPLEETITEAWEAVKANDPKAFSTAMRNVLTISANTK